MRGIALKIFLSFWLIFAVLLGSFALLPDSPVSIRFLDHLYAHGVVASQLLERQGALSCSEYIAAVKESTGLRMALFGADGAVACQAAGDDVADIRRYAQAGGRSPTSAGPAGLVPVQAPSGTRFQAVGLALPGFGQGAIAPPFPYRTVAFVIVISGIVCFAMARYLATPLRLVRDTSYRLAAGDLQARAGPSVGQRRDEIGDLVRDFDAMAARIEALVHAQNQLLSDISHELRSPLARLNVALELARRKAQSNLASELNRIEVEAERMNELIGRVLSLARAESDPQAMADLIELHAVVSQVTADAQYEAQRQDKSVEFHASAEPTIQGHAPLVASAVDNVVRNGLRYTRPRTSVTVTLDASDRDAVITVRDHGPGVPVSELERIFSPFHRVESGRNRETGGVGLGLAIARRAVAVHRGAISAENAPDGGLLVTIRLPLHTSVLASHSL